MAVGAAIATGELAAGIVEGVPSPTLSIGRGVIALQPPGAKDLFVSLFGSNDKLALDILIIAVALLIGAGLGILAARQRSVATVAIAAFAGLGFVASIGDPNASLVLAPLAAALEAVVGIGVLNYLVPLAEGPATPPKRAKAQMPDWTRRALLIRGGAIAAASIVAGTIGRMMLDAQRAPVEVANFPTPARAVALPNGADFGIQGLTPIVMPNDLFYRIDTALTIPNVDVSTWQLKVTGMVDNEVTLTYDQLVQLPIIEQYVTIACVSNYVGGNLVGNAAWRGVELRKVLAMAGVQSSADQLVGRSVDGFTVGMPVEWVMDPSRTPMIAIGMNGDPLPRAHGYPARLIVPGLYGYVSATKWVTELELTTFDAFSAYWVPLGWAQKAPILTQSRIDIPQDASRVSPGQVTVAGVAWAPDRGVTKVEVAIRQAPADPTGPQESEWQPTRLSTPISKATWVQWVYNWQAPAGLWEIQVRATDGTGTVQTADVTQPAPDGARGHHTIQVSVG